MAYNFVNRILTIIESEKYRAPHNSICSWQLRLRAVYLKVTWEIHVLLSRMLHCFAIREIFAAIRIFSFTASPYYLETIHAFTPAILLFNWEAKNAE